MDKTILSVIILVDTFHLLTPPKVTSPHRATHLQTFAASRTQPAVGLPFDGAGQNEYSSHRRARPVQLISTQLGPRPLRPAGGRSRPNRPTVDPPEGTLQTAAGGGFHWLCGKRSGKIQTRRKTRKNYTENHLPHHVRSKMRVVLVGVGSYLLLSGSNYVTGSFYI